jgi:hypothetical protein
MQQPKSGRLIFEVSKSHIIGTHTQKIGLLWMGEQLVAEPATHTTHQKNMYIHAFSGIPTRDLSIPAAADQRLKPHGHMYKHTQLHDQSLHTCVNTAD